MLHVTLLTDLLSLIFLSNNLEQTTLRYSDEFKYTFFYEKLVYKKLEA